LTCKRLPPGCRTLTIHCDFRPERLLGEGERIYREKQDGFLKAAMARYEHAQALWTKLEDRPRQSDTMCHIAYLRNEAGESKLALEPYQQALDLWTKEQDQSGKGTALQGMAWVAGSMSLQKDAEEWANQAIEIHRGTGNLRGQADTLFVIENFALRSRPK
jgi:hypothetical protein